MISLSRTPPPRSPTCCGPTQQVQPRLDARHHVCAAAHVELEPARCGVPMAQHSDVEDRGGPFGEYGQVLGRCGTGGDQHR